MMDVRQQAVTGLVPPQLGEALIRQVWPSVAAYPLPASLGRVLIRSIVAAPLGWLLLAPLYFLKIMPFVARRYTLTNRRLMAQRGLKPAPMHEVALADIGDVRVVTDANSRFYRAGTVEVLSSSGEVMLRLTGVPEPESFRHSIIDTCQAWVPGRANHEPVVSGKTQVTP